MSNKRSSVHSGITLMQDEWSSIDYDLIIAHCLHSGTKFHLLILTGPCLTQKTAEHCADLTKKCHCLRSDT